MVSTPFLSVWRPEGGGGMSLGAGCLVWIVRRPRVITISLDYGGETPMGGCTMERDLGRRHTQWRGSRGGIIR